MVDHKYLQYFCRFDRLTKPIFQTRRLETDALVYQVMFFDIIDGTWANLIHTSLRSCNRFKSNLTYQTMKRMLAMHSFYN